MLDKNATNHGFTCAHCGAAVSPAPETARNHCPQCLWSLHVDSIKPGDRASPCGGQMRPAAIFQKHGDWVVIHSCELCGHEHPNRLAPDDNFETVIELSATQND
jgi:hypothetical protein